MLHTFLWGMENRVILIYGLGILKISDVPRQGRKTITTRVVWENYLGMLLSTDPHTKLYVGHSESNASYLFPWKLQ